VVTPDACKMHIIRNAFKLNLDYTTSMKRRLTTYNCKTSTTNRFTPERQSRARVATTSTVTAWHALSYGYTAHETR